MTAQEARELSESVPAISYAEEQIRAVALRGERSAELPLSFNLTARKELASRGFRIVETTKKQGGGKFDADTEPYDVRILKISW